MRFVFIGSGGIDRQKDQEGCEKDCVMAFHLWLADVADAENTSRKAAGRRCSQGHENTIEGGRPTSTGISNIPTV